MPLSVRGLRSVVIALASTLIVAVTFAANLPAAPASRAASTPATRPHRNVIVFIADGLRHDAVNATDAPTLFALRQRGVHFVNSH